MVKYPQIGCGGFVFLGMLFLWMTSHDSPAHGSFQDRADYLFGVGILLIILIVTIIVCFRKRRTSTILNFKHRQEIKATIDYEFGLLQTIPEIEYKIVQIDDRWIDWKKASCHFSSNLSNLEIGEYYDTQFKRNGWKFYDISDCWNTKGYVSTIYKKDLYFAKISVVKSQLGTLYYVSIEWAGGNSPSDGYN
ncbi:hypothetical protein [Sporomusa sp.]|uniref:hypothetical protein n=1 Tax=Sporomusa sp. TaxID=2078658 RepID=UPI002B98DB9D|nr:hypothetical protein [Sporomusa sp.]HWR45602.1 hypothetical protein [Sporomusa sp.]